MNRACFPKEKHQNSQKWAKFMNFSFWPFLWFGLPGRLLTEVSNTLCGDLHRVLQGAAQRGGAILLHFYDSPDPFFMQQHERFLP